MKELGSVSNEFEDEISDSKYFRSQNVERSTTSTTSASLAACVHCSRCHNRLKLFRIMIVQ